MRNRKYKTLMYEALSKANEYAYESTLDAIVEEVRKEKKDLKPHELHLGHE